MQTGKQSICFLQGHFLWVAIVFRGADRASATAWLRAAGAQATESPPHSGALAERPHNRQHRKECPKACEHVACSFSAAAGRLQAQSTPFQRSHGDVARALCHTTSPSTEAGSHARHYHHRVGGGLPYSTEAQYGVMPRAQQA